jgi:hypothetical protein
MNSTNLPLSNNKLRRLQGWARTMYPMDGHDRSAIIVEYLAQLDAEEAERLMARGWPTVAEVAEANWPEAFAVFKKE